MSRKAGKASIAEPERVARQQALVEAYARTGNLEAASAQVGITSRTAERWLYAVVDLGPRARAMRDTWLAAQSSDFDRQAKSLIREADQAIAALAAIAQGPQADAEGKVSRSWSIGAQARVQAAVAILDRAGHKPIERVEQAVQWDDVSRELVGVDTAAVLREALASIAGSSAAQPIVSDA